MYYSLKTDCYYRKFGTVGYITRPIISIEEVVDENGALFIEKLGYEPRNIDDIITELGENYIDSNLDEIKKDAIEFYSSLVADGFLNTSESLKEFKNDGFDYATLPGKLAHTSIKSQLEESSSTFLSSYFKDIPCIDTFHIELTSKCNERCIHCYIPHEKKDTDIDYELMISAINQCKEMNVLTLIFSGGEPMLHPHFCEFLKYAKDLDFNVTVLSNLTLLTDENIEALKYKHASCVNVSLYSMNPDVHDSITTIKGSQEITKKNILKLIENNIPVQINCPVMKQNKDSFQDVIEWGQDHKCAVITDYLIIARSDGSIDNLVNRLTDDELRSVISKLIDKDVVIKSNLNNENIEGETIKISPDDKVCGVGMSTLCMIANGDVYPCAGWQKYVCGNIKETPLKTIWDESPQVNYLRSLRQKDFKKCVNCEDQNYCMMCMSRNSNEDQEGDLFNIPKITCEAARIYHEIVEDIYDVYKKSNKNI